MNTRTTASQSSGPLAGRNALVTGASRGIGAACALRLAEAGADVAVLGRSLPDLDKVSAQIRALGRRALVVGCDVTVPEQIEAACTRVENDLGPVDVLVNNAGGPRFQAAIMDVRPEGWQKVFDLNLTSTLLFCQRLGRGMAERRTGTIVNVSSIAVHAPWPAIAPYGAAKSGIRHLTQALAAELGPSGVRVTSVSPAWIDTDINTAYTRDPELSDAALDLVPLDRWGEPDDVAHAVVFLASPLSGFITGIDLPIDGGFSVSMPRSTRRILNRAAPAT
ncbi:NAD(P)-dependent dehydrogenase (short-subunit alcohol dehydrogenase family) [Streptosporangium becharense]|uniref:NAD(P)-dependent dehydrogenase (Short-subunit alcohol dehydrogenase family) n=1 Tax=Streptosporangium becharense TaxID=1816182 RepID=A0A7W9IA80_9ACTN|nr:SDR family NAD(P)-dependent oxidoreductase [Streptosporangium becharense]MBB2915308.1 NAD(P)-dependent dehydrogenase (short-subunit alcohol dehydrogenase family) [Streptosporangium becharense]MBB5816994.1 NAD(P)-dependent dehydrogenase (short-subunit alcohol dehydrogenase family) [Streptosporangium becharense]